MTTKDTVLAALFAALIVVLSLMPPIPLPAIPVPVTLQTLGAMLAGAMLGPLRGALACL
ncbi:ECF transporter S component, partial [Bordetella pertussis]